MSQPSTTYEPRIPVQDVLYEVVRDHYEAFRAQAASIRDGAGLPTFVEEAAFARSASASRAVALAEAGVSRVPALRSFDKAQDRPERVEGRLPGRRLRAFSL